MRISNLRHVGSTAYQRLHQGLSTAAGVVEKSAHLYTRVQPLLQHVVDSRDVDIALLNAYGRFHDASAFAGQIDRVVNG